jgi:hypothetical protein
MALSVQDVLGVEGVAHAMATMDNIANSHSDTIRERRLDDIEPARTHKDHLREVFGGDS